jgi:serine/threonine-protein kinase
MAKVFTITEGLENLGALKTGGQGSVYKGKRMGEIITAIKLLPTPIMHEDLKDKNYSDFVNEVEKLKKVNEEHNPNVVTILGSGITETGCFPFIEMEYIEGPDLCELMKPPHPPLFSLHEVIKVAIHISNAIAHCHKCDIKHGDIKSNNVKYNVKTGNYTLLDFGLAIMSDEDRRTSLRHAGAIEFMAPEQNKGEVFFETDVYSFGVIIYELIAGRVPFPLQDSGETARNAVMVSHLETPPPDFLQLRREHLPSEWSVEKQQNEMQVPEWLSTMVYKCLEKKPEYRYKNGIELHDYILSNVTSGSFQEELIVADSEEVQSEMDRLRAENHELRQELVKYQKAAEANEERIANLKGLILEHESSSELTTSSAYATRQSDSRGVSKGAFYGVLVLLLLLAGFTVYSVFLNNKVSSANTAVTVVDSTDSLNAVNQATMGTEGSVVPRTNRSSASDEKLNQGDQPESGSNNNPENNNQDTTSAFGHKLPPKEKPSKKDTTSNNNTKTDSTGIE